MFNTSVLSGPNGLNFSKSVGVPTSRLERVRSYLRTVGPSTKRDILRDVFGFATLDESTVRGWGSTLFSLGVKCGHLTHSRVDGKVVWSLPEENPKVM